MSSSHLDNREWRLAEAKGFFFFFIANNCILELMNREKFFVRKRNPNANDSGLIFFYVPFSQIARLMSSSADFRFQVKVITDIYDR